jgi:hypothetical protein
VEKKAGRGPAKQQGLGGQFKTSLGALVRKTALFVHFLYKNDHFAKTGSGQT